MPESSLKHKRANARHILSVPLSPEQLADLSHRAGRKPLSSFVRDELFPANDNTPKRTRPRPTQKTNLAAEVLGKLGLAKDALNIIAHSIASGLLPFAPDTEAAVLKACADLAEMKSILMKALAIRER